MGQRAAIVTLGCARNDVDSEELAARLRADGWDLVDEPADADAVLVNTCGFVAAAKKDSIDTLLAAADLKSGDQVVVAAGCLAQRYGRELASELPEVDAILGFDDYESIGSTLRSIASGAVHVSHAPSDRRTLLPISPLARAGTAVSIPGHARVDPPDLAGGPASGPRVVRQRLGSGPSAPLKLASGCDRRCSFCAIPSFRGAFVSRTPDEIITEARWLVDHGVREIVLVSENSTSYGKDFGDIRSLEALLPRLASIDGLEWIRVSYLQPAEMRPTLIDTIASTAKVVPYFDLSFQHSAPSVLRAMRRFGDTDSFLGLLDQVRAAAPDAGVRSNFIAGFPGETEQDFDELQQFLLAARLDAIGVFGYSDEDGTEAETYADKLDDDEVDARVRVLTDLSEALTTERATQRIGETVQLLVEDIDSEQAIGRVRTQAPEVDGSATVEAGSYRAGDLVECIVVATDGVDLVLSARARG